MVKTTNSNIRSSGLDAIVEQLKINNQQSLKQTEAINTLISDNQSARADAKKALVAERTVEQRKESLAKKSRLEALRERKPTGIVGSFTRGAIGGTAYGALGAGLGGLGIGGGIGALLRGGAGLAGRGLLFGGLIAATNSMIQGMLDRTFDNIKPEDIGFKDEERAKEKITGGMNAAIALKFLGARGRTALLTGIGLAFSDQITDFISNRLGTDRLTAPDWMQKTFGLTEDQLTINLNDGKVAAAVSTAVSLVAGQIIFWGTKKVGAGVKNLIFGKPNNPETLKNMRSFTPPQKAPVVFSKGPNAPKAITTNLDKPVTKLSDFADDLKRIQSTGANVGGLTVPKGPGARPLLNNKFASVEQVKKILANEALVKSNQQMADAKKRILVAEKRFANQSKGVGSLSNAVKSSKSILGKTFGFLTRASGPASVAISGTLGVLDEERIAAGQDATFRTVAGIGEGAASFLDFIVNNTYGLAMQGINIGLEKAGSDFRVQEKFNYTGAFREGTFVGYENMKNALAPTEKEIQDLTLGGSNLQGGNLLITNDQINNNTTMGTNNFSLNSGGVGFINPYAETVR